jgi:hypothetical protein
MGRPNVKDKVVWTYDGHSGESQEVKQAKLAARTREGLTCKYPRGLRLAVVGHSLLAARQACDEVVCLLAVARRARDEVVVFSPSQDKCATKSWFATPVQEQVAPAQEPVKPVQEPVKPMNAPPCVHAPCKFP